MKNASVTKELKKTMNQLKINTNNYYCFSDPRKNKKAVGVKFTNLELSETLCNKIVRNMQRKGYQFVRITQPTNKIYSYARSHYFGLRFTFYKKEFSFIK